MEDDLGGNVVELTFMPEFQSTSPVWRTTCSRARLDRRTEYFNPRPPCGGRPYEATEVGARGRISIHVPRVEDDPTTWLCMTRLTNFNPRPPCGGRLLQKVRGIPLHHFNPRPPCGGRLARANTVLADKPFQSTSPVWRTTKPLTVSDLAIKISIHVPRVEDDRGGQQS